jgi:hypothetical protein
MPSTVSTLKTYFQTGDKPTQTQFYELIDGVLNLQDGGTVVGATTFSAASIHSAGITCHATPTSNFLPNNFKITTDTDDQDYSSLTSGNYNIIVNTSLASGKFIRLPEATTANGGMTIRILYNLAPAAAHYVGFVTTDIVGGATCISDATEGQATTNAALASSAVGTGNHRIELDVNEDVRAGGHPGTLLEFFYHGTTNQVAYRGHLIGDVDTATLASHFSTTAVNA